MILEADDCSPAVRRLVPMTRIKGVAYGGRASVPLSRGGAALRSWRPGVLPSEEWQRGRAVSSAGPDTSRCSLETRSIPQRHSCLVTPPPAGLTLSRFSRAKVMGGDEGGSFCDVMPYHRLKHNP